MSSNHRSVWNFRARKSLACGLALLAGFLFSKSVCAIAPAPLPSFPVQSLDGTSMLTSSWTLKGKSVLIYVKGDCRPCAALLGRLRKKEYPELAGHTIIVVGDASPAGVKAFQQLYPDLSAATWYADPSHAAVAALHLHGAPVIMGLNGNIVQWALSGVMEHASQQQSVLNTWCAK